MKKSHVALLLIAAFALGIFINKTYEIRQAHAASNRTLRVEMRKTRQCIAMASTMLVFTQLWKKRGRRGLTKIKMTRIDMAAQGGFFYLVEKHCDVNAIKRSKRPVRRRRKGKW